MASVRLLDVVIVDDHRMFNEALTSALEQQGDMRISHRCTSLAELFGYLDTEPAFDVLLLDNNLPDGSGINSIPRIRQQAPSQPVIVVTATAQMGAYRSALRNGCAGFVLKSDPVSVVAGAIRSARSGVLTVSPAMRMTDEGAEDERQLVPKLSAREHAVLSMVAAGDDLAAISTHFMISPNTARNHIQKALAKLGAHSRTEAVAIALRQGIIQPPS